MKISIVIPTAGFFRHNESLWPVLAACYLSTGVEIIAVMQDPPSPKLLARLVNLQLPFRKCVVEENATVGKMISAGLAMATGDHVIVMHDDVVAENLPGLIKQLSQPGMTAPHVHGSHNADQADVSGGPVMTTRFLDRCMFALSRDCVEIIRGVDLDCYRLDGYQIAIQWALADRGIAPWIVEGVVEHAGGATARDVLSVDRLADRFRADVYDVARVLGVHVENEIRPALPRIIPRGNKTPVNFAPFVCHLSELDDVVNSVDCEHFTIRDRGRTEKRIRLGHKFAVPSSIDTLDVAFPHGTGIGDALMHSAALSAFSRIYPDVVIRTFSRAHANQVFARIPGIRDAIAINSAAEIPDSATTWNHTNASEGMPDFGFNLLGIGHVPVESRAMFFDAQPVSIDNSTRNAIGIQIAGGWRHKRYRRIWDLARSLAAVVNVRLFSPHPDMPVPADLERLVVETPTLDHVAMHQRQLAAWIGFDSGGSYLANANGCPTLWLVASHDMRGLIGRCGARAPWRVIQAGNPARCSAMFRVSCRQFGNGLYRSTADCPLMSGDFGAQCLDDLDPALVIGELNQLLKIRTEKC